MNSNSNPLDPVNVITQALEVSTRTFSGYQKDIVYASFSSTILRTKSNDPPLMARLYKKIIQRVKVRLSSNWDSIIEKAHPILVEAWASVLPMNLIPDADTVFLFMHEKTLAKERITELEGIFNRYFSREWSARYAELEELYKNINYTKPCIGVHMAIVDATARGNRTFSILINGKSTKIQIMRTNMLPVDVTHQLRTGLISRCEYGIHMSMDPAKYVYVLAFDSTGTLVGAAECDKKKSPNTMWVEYVCSAKKCKGAGTYVMKTIEYYAHLLKKKRVRLQSASNARVFYRKINYNSNSNIGNHMVKYMPASKRVKRS